ncbi:MAG TPA: hypothetical protein DCY47_11380, partial [Candidatus Accumulibacter sp.]|nr:hypothetical protein [Accumulibacter sp.]
MRTELNNGGDNSGARDQYYVHSVHEGSANDNNRGSGELTVAYREADLQVDGISLSTTSVGAGSPLTVSWQVSNRGSRETRTSSWLDGLYLSRDTSLDEGDFALLADAAQIGPAAQRISLSQDGRPKFLRPGESYSASATFELPDSLSGDFHLIIRTDTAINSDGRQRSTIREGLPGLVILGDGTGQVREFRDEGNNQASTLLSITPGVPPDLQVAQVGAPARVLAGQKLVVDWRVANRGGDTPASQATWNDLVYLSRDRFLDLDQDHYLGYRVHDHGLAAGDSYDARESFAVPAHLAGAYYVFVVSDPARAWGSGNSGKLRESGNEDNNTGAAPQPIVVETPPAADLKPTAVLLPARAEVGEEIRIEFSVINDSINPARGQWTDALYLSADSDWDAGDILIGKLAHSGDLAGGATYSAALTASLPPVRDGNWRVIVRSDLYNEVFEGSLSDAASGLGLPPGEANNRSASGTALLVSVPELQLGSPLVTTLVAGRPALYRVAVAPGESLRVSLDAASDAGDNELYLRFADAPSGHHFDAAYGNPVAADQQAVVSSTRAGDYYVLARARQAGSAQTVSLRADLLPLSVTGVSPDHGGIGNDAQPWITIDISGSHFHPAALVRLSRPGVFEAEADRWQVLDSSHIRAIFDSRRLPPGLYDLTVLNPDGQRVTEAQCFLVEPAVETEVTIAVGGPRSLAPGDGATYSVALQSLGNLDTPYVHFAVGVPEMGYSPDLLAGLPLPYLVFASSLAGQPDGPTADAAGNTLSFGPTPTLGIGRSDIPWARLDGVNNSDGHNLAAGYAFDLAGGGFAASAVRLQTYPGLGEWLAHDFGGLRARLYMQHPEWQALGLLDGGVADLDRIAADLGRKFLSRVDGEHVTGLEALAMPFRFDIVATATALSRDEFIAEQQAHAQRLRTAILADPNAPASLSVIAADADQWQAGWLAALEAAGILRPADEAAPIRAQAKVLSLNATLGAGILLSRGGDRYRTHADLAAFFAKVQEWYGDTARHIGDASARKAPVDYFETRQNRDGSVAVPVPHLADRNRFDLGAAHASHFLDFSVFVGDRSELEYLRHVGVLDEDFRPVAAQSLDFARHLPTSVDLPASESALLRVRGPQAQRGSDGQLHVAAGVALPYQLAFTNPADSPAGQLRIISQIDPSLDPASFRLGDLRIGDLAVHLPADRAAFQGDFDFSGSKGFILRVSAGVDTTSRVATWLLQAIDPATGEVVRDRSHGLLPVADAGSGTATTQQGFVSYSVRADDDALSGSNIHSAARLLADALPPVDSQTHAIRLDTTAPRTHLTVTPAGATSAAGVVSFDLRWQSSDELSGVRTVSLYVAEDGGSFRLWQRRLPAGTEQAVFVGEAGRQYEFIAVATDHAGNSEAQVLANVTLPEDGARQEILAALGANETVASTPAAPAAAEDRSYPASDLFAAAARQLPGAVAGGARSDLETVLAPFALRSFARGHAVSAADIGAQALVEMPDGSILASVGALRNEIHRYDADGLPAGHGASMPLFILDAPVIDMQVDALGQLWAMTGAELLQLDPASGRVLQRLRAPGEQPLTHALAIDPGTGEIYVSTGSGILVFNPAASDSSRAWKSFSRQRVGDLAFAPDGRLWAVKRAGSEFASVAANARSDILSFPMSGRDAGRAELEYRLAGIIDSIAFAAPDSHLAGLLFASSQPGQQPSGGGVSAARQGSVWMIELASRRSLELASGGSRGESIVATHDGRILIAQTRSIDEIALQRAPTVSAVTVPDGALVPLPLNAIGVVFDQEMHLGDAGDTASVLHRGNYRLLALQPGAMGETGQQPASVSWDRASRTAWLEVSGLAAGGYRLQIASRIESSTHTPLANDFESRFTALEDLSHQLRLDFSNTRANRATGELSYDLSLTNIGSDEIAGPLALLLDPGRHFGATVAGAVAGGGEQADLWLIDLGDALNDLGGKLAAGATIAAQTISIVPASRFSAYAGIASIVKANLGHGVYAAPRENRPPLLRLAAAPDSDELPPARVGEAWSAAIEA